MGRRILSHFRTQWAGFLALFLVLTGGTAWALTQNSVGTAQIKPKAIKTSDIANDAVTSPKVKNGSLLGVDFAAGQLPAGPRGPAGPTGPTGPTGTNGSPDTPQQVLAKLVQVDGSGSGLDADSLDAKNVDQLAAGRIHQISTSNVVHPLVPGLSYATTSCTNSDMEVDFFTTDQSGTANAMSIAYGIETPGSSSGVFNIANGAQNSGFPFTGGEIDVDMRSSSGTAAAELQLIIDAGSRTYSVALHMFSNVSGPYCEAYGTATLAE